MDTGVVEKGQREEKRAEKALRRKPAYLVFSGRTRASGIRDIDFKSHLPDPLKLFRMRTDGMVGREITLTVLAESSSCSRKGQ